MKIDKKRIGGASADAILLTIIKLITAAMGLVVSRLLSEHLAVRDYGTYSQMLLLVSSISAVTIFGMMDGVNFFYATKKETGEQESYIATMFALQVTVSTVAGIMVLAFTSPLVRYFNNKELAPILIFAAVLPFLQNIMFMSQALFVAVGKARLLAYRNFVVSLIRLVVVYIVAMLVPNITIVLTTSAVLDIGQIMFFWIVLNKNGCYIRLRRIQPKLIKNILRYCTPMAVYIMINSLNRDLDKYLVSLVTDTETLALYANASKQLPFDILMSSFCTVLVPYITRYISEKKNDMASNTYKLFLEITYISTGILCCAALASAPQFMKLLYSNKYTAGLAIFCVYILVDLVKFTNITLVLTAAGKTRWLMTLGFATIGLNAVLNVICYKLMGLIGPAIATLATTALMGLLMMICNAKVLNTRLSAFFDLKYMVVFVLESVALTFALSALRDTLDRLDVHYFIIVVLIACLYILTMFLLNGKRLIKDMRKVSRMSI
ncbi:MAG: hypothetical protein E7627_04785 [Ruminococcaceae bacterium]|nr:hypothetical protein [Oscillospiraceae bacterium]